MWDILLGGSERMKTWYKMLYWRYPLSKTILSIWRPSPPSTFRPFYMKRINWITNKPQLLSRVVRSSWWWYLHFPRTQTLKKTTIHLSVVMNLLYITQFGLNESFLFPSLLWTSLWSKWCQFRLNSLRWGLCLEIYKTMAWVWSVSNTTTEIY